MRDGIFHDGCGQFGAAAVWLIRTSANPVSLPRLRLYCVVRGRQLAVHEDVGNLGSFLHLAFYS